MNLRGNIHFILVVGLVNQVSQFLETSYTGIIFKFNTKIPI